ncbi:hypothetical protein MNBD_GAMMA22-2264 [hydrothermal vent metagenome]|uniref:Phosphonate ABC transporter phosphate-binding periplasmic component (TC 3.A.1.9.1) n=1 Tax=hydrothermal vent metagenome TaxID=652676 RepID=A0A3B1AG66_9ZZZZ
MSFNIIKIVLLVLISILLPVLGYFYTSENGFNLVKKAAIFSDRKLVMGVFPRRNSVKTIRMFNPIAKHLSEKIGMNVELETVKNFSTFWNNVKLKKYDIVHYNQLHYTLSNKSQGYSIILKNNEFGSSYLKPVIAVRDDSDIKTISDLKNKTVHFGGGRLAMISHIANRVAIREQGVDDDEYKWGYAKNPPTAAHSVFNLSVDAAGLGDVVLRFSEIRHSLENHKFVTIYKGPDIPHLPWAVSDKVDDKLSIKIQSALMALNDSEKGAKILKGAALTGFVIASDKEYDVVREIYQKYKKYNQANQ